MLLADVTQPLQMNAFQEIFPSFVRVGCADFDSEAGCMLNASYIARTMSRVIQGQMGANGYVSTQAISAVACEI